jgi:hypothetical protein
MGLKLKTCCGCWELKVGVILIGVVMALISTAQVLFGIVTLSIRITSKVSGSILIVSGLIKFASDVTLVSV